MLTLEDMQQLATVNEAAKKLDVSPQRVHQIIHAGRLEAHMIAGRYFITHKSLESYRPLRPWAALKAEQDGK